VSCVVGEYVLRLDVFVDQAAFMEMAERARQANCQAEKTGWIEKLLPLLLHNAVQRLTAWVGEKKDGPSFMTRECQRLGRPGGRKLGCQ
jgi:hypothetical protein